jgi:uncharacterized protein (DUF1697 family)
MARYVALFDSIKAGGSRLTMAELRKAFEGEEFDQVETVVASDNILFSHPERPDEGLEEKLRLALHERFELDSPVLVRSRCSLAQALADNPFADGGDAQFVHTLFLDGLVDPQDFARFDAERTGPDRIVMGDRALHIDYVAGSAEGRLVSAFIERRLGRRGTVRNLRTLQRILAKMDEN